MDNNDAVGTPTDGLAPASPQGSYPSHEDGAKPALGEGVLDWATSTEFLRAVMDSVPHLIMVKDLAGRYRLANKAFSAFHGLIPADMVGYTDADLPGLSKEVAEAQEAMDRAVLESGESQVHTDVPFIRPNGELRRMQLRKSPLWGRDGEPVGILVVAEDITDSQALREELQLQQRQLRSIIDTIPARIMVTDRNGRAVLINEALAELLGVSPAEALASGRGCPDMDAENKARSDSEMQAVLAEGSSFDRERVRRTATGESVYDRLLRLPLRDPDGAVTGALNLCIDITKQKRLEAELRQSQKMEAIGQLAGSVAHDFNNVLQIVQGYSQIALNHAGDSPPLHAALQRVLGAAERAGSLTRQLLVFGRRKVLQPKVIDLNTVLHELVKLLSQLIGEHIDFREHAAPEPAWVYADPSMIEQLVMNLCVNARDAMPDGGVLEVATELITLDEPFCQQHDLPRVGPHIRLTVTDNGAGICDSLLPHIFEPFFTTKAEGQGTGLGLSIAYGIVKQHDGLIRVTSRPDEGTTFTVLLPACNPLKTESRTEVTIPAEGGTETVLVVEDEEDVLDLLIDLLRSQGYRVLSARDGEEALEVYRQRSAEIDLVLLDVVMPKLSGREVVHGIRALSGDVPILLSTGYTQNAVDSEFIAEHGLSYIEKPYTPTELFSRVRDCLDHGSRSS